MKLVNVSGRGRLVGLAVVSALTVASFAASPVAAGSPTTFWVDMGDACVGVDSEPNSDLNFLWRDFEGRVKLDAAAVSSGFNLFCQAGEQVEVGDQLTIDDGGAVRQLVVPELSIRLLRTTDRLKGTGPSGATLRVRCERSDPFRHFEPCVWKRTVLADAEGNWAASVPFDFIGDAVMHVRWKNVAGDRVFAWGTAPFVQVTLGRSTLNGATKPNAIASVELDSGGSATVQGDPRFGEFNGQFVNGSHEPVVVQPGDALTTSNISGDANWIVPDVEATAAASTDVVSGQCHDTGASQDLVNVVLYRSGQQRGWALLNTEADGSFSFDFLSEEDLFWDTVNVRPGDRLVVRCMQAGGDWVQRVIFAE